MQSSEMNKVSLTVEQIIQTSIQAIGKEQDIKNVENISTLAKCKSPQGSYTTEVQTTSKGYGYFKQVYSYRPKAFEAVTKGVREGFQVDSDKIEKLPENAIYAIRTHYFHHLILNIKQFFHQFEKAEVVEINGKKVYRVKAKDELNQDCWLFFDVNRGFLTAFHIQNPDNKEEIIKTEFSEWKEVESLQLPYHLEIDQNGKIYSFDFSQIIINNPRFEEKLLDYKK